MGALTDYLEAKTLDHVLGTAAYPQPATHVGLFTVMPGEDGTGGTEAVWTGYARQAVTFGAAVQGDPTEASNDALVDFGDPDADMDIVGFGLFDAASGGNLLVHQAFAAAVSVQAGVLEQLQFQVGDLGITLD